MQIKWRRILIFSNSVLQEMHVIQHSKIHFTINVFVWYVRLFRAMGLYRWVASQEWGVGRNFYGKKKEWQKKRYRNAFLRFIFSQSRQQKGCSWHFGHLRLVTEIGQAWQQRSWCCICNRISQNFRVECFRYIVSKREEARDLSQSLPRSKAQTLAQQSARNFFFWALLSWSATNRMKSKFSFCKYIFERKKKHTQKWLCHNE